MKRITDIMTYHYQNYLLTEKINNIAAKRLAYKLLSQFFILSKN